MANPQLVDYIKGQFAAGVPREGIIGSLRAAGWEEADIAESMKLIEANMPVAIAEAKPAGSPSFVAVKPVSLSVMPVTGVKPVASSPQNFSPAKMFTDVEGTKKPVEVAGAKNDAKMSEGATVKTLRGGGMMGSISSLLAFKKEWLIPGVMGIIILGLAGDLWYFSRANADLKSQLASQEQANQSAILNLQSQVSQLTTENATLKSNRDVAVSNASEIKAELSLFVAGIGTSTPLAITIKGTLSAGTPYTLTTANGITVTLKNAKDVGVVAVLKPLGGTTVEIAGTHLAGSREIIVTSVNGTTIQVAAPVTATTTASSASSTIPGSTTTTPYR